MPRSDIDPKFLRERLLAISEGLKEGYFTEEDRNAYLQAWAQPGALTGGLNYYRAARAGPTSTPGTQAGGDFTTDTSVLVVKVPTLVIWGEQDQALLTGNLEGLDKFVLNLTIKRIPDGSHWVVHEKPTLINTCIRDFIEDTGSD